MSILLLGLSGCYSTRMPSEAEFASLKQEGDAFIEHIEAFRRRNGYYPQSFADAELRPSNRKYGGFRYGMSTESSYRISIGNTHDYGFLMYYMNSIGDWMIDSD